MKKSAFWAICLFLLLYLVIFSFQKINLPTADLGRHIKNGEIFLHSAEYGISWSSILYTNLFSYTYPTFPFINHHWGSGVLIYLLFSVFGWSGLSLGYFLCIASALLLLLLVVRDEANISDIFLPALFLIPLIASRQEIRPEGLSYLFIAVFIYILYRFSKGRITYRALFFLPFLELLWVNTHIYFIFGIYIAGVFFLEALIHRKEPGGKEKAKLLGGTTFFTALAALVNPYGLRGAIYPFTIFQNYGYRIVENQSIGFLENLRLSDPDFLWYKIALALVVLSTIFILVKNRKETAVALSVLSVSFAVLGYFGIRFIAVFALVSLPLLADNIKTLRQKYFQSGDSAESEVPVRLTAVISCLIIFLTLVNFSSRLPWNRDFGLGLVPDSTGSIDFIVQTGARGPIFNNYDIGGMIIFYLFPKEKVFVDNRPETYPAEFFQKIYIPMQEDETVWQVESQKENFNMIYFYRLDYTPWAQAFLLKRVADPLWAPVFADSQTIIFLRRNEQNKKIIDRFELPRSMFGIN